MPHYHKATFDPNSYEREKVREIIPTYLEEGAGNLISFLEEYYNYLNRDSQPSYELGHIISENDIDITSEKYLDAIQNEIAKIVPKSKVVDRNTLYSRIVHFYKTKGTIESVNTFFKLFFDDDPTVYTPGQDLLKLSEGAFEIPVKNWITSNVLHRSTRDELFTNSGLSVGVKNQPIMGKDFKINFTVQLNKNQPTSRTYLVSTKDPITNPNVIVDGTTQSFGPGTIDIFSESSTTGAGFLFQQSESRKVTTLSDHESTILYLPVEDNLYNNEWHNVVVSYKENDDDIKLEVSGSDIIVSDSDNEQIDGTYVLQSGGHYLRTDATYTNTGLYKEEEGSGKTMTITNSNKATCMKNGEQYIIVGGVSGIADWTTIGASSATPSIGDTFTFNNTTPTLASETAEIQHYVRHWHFREYTSGSAYTVKYRHSLVDDLHVGSSANVVVAYRALEGESDLTRQGGSAGTPRAVVTDIVKLPFMNAETQESKQTATVIIEVDNVEKLRKNIPNNGGYSLATDSFSIFSKNRSANTQDDTRGSITAFSVENAHANGFDYRFTANDAATLSTLADVSGNGNDGNITLNTSGSSYSSAVAPTVTDITTFTVINFLPGLDTANGVYNVSGTGIDETWTGPNGHKFVIVKKGGLYNWRFYDVDDNNPDITSLINSQSLTTLPKPWEIVSTRWNPNFPSSSVLEAIITDKWRWSNEATSLGTKPNAIQPLPTVDSYKQDSNGFLSSNKKIQDSNFWQDFSYEIQTQIEGTKWKESYNRLVHPAGLKFFIKLLLESSVTGRWNLVESYVGTFENEDAWLFNLIPPALRSLNSYEAYHTPRYQPGWLAALTSLFVTAFANISQRGIYNGVNYRDGQDVRSSTFIDKLKIASNNIELKNNYPNGIVQEPVNSSLRNFVTFEKVLNGFSATSGTIGFGLSYAGFPLTQSIVKAGDSIKIAFRITQGSGQQTTIGLLKSANDPGASGFTNTQTYFRSNVTTISGSASGIAGFNIIAAEDGCQFIGFMVDNDHATSQTIEISDFTVIRPSSEPQPVNGGLEYYRHNRNIVTSEIDIKHGYIDGTDNSRAEYVYNSYQGTSTRNPTFWIDPREIRRTGYLDQQIGSFVLDFDDVLASSAHNRAGLSNPHGAIITVPGIEESGTGIGNDRIEFFGKGGPESEGGYDNIVHYNVTVVDVGGDNKFVLNGDQSLDFKFHQGTKYIFDVSDSSNENHPMRFSLTNSTTMLDSKYISTHGTAGEYGADGSPATVTLTARFDGGFGADIYMYCTNHGVDMGSLYNPIVEQT
jgi:hypothetical protein